MLIIIVSTLMLTIYRYLLAKFPFNLLAIVLMQLVVFTPNVMFTIALFDFDSVKSISGIIVNVTSLISLPLIYLVMRKKPSSFTVK